MRKSNLELENQIKQKTLELLLKKEPCEITMRDIAQNCGVTATTIYHYFKSKDDIFRKISLESLAELKAFMEERIFAAKNSKQKLIFSMEAFRDWCFKNPRKALLLMSKVAADDAASDAELLPYYECNRLGQAILDECVKAGVAKSKNTLLDVNALVFGLWGCVESILQKRADTKLWRRGKEYTDRFIEITANSILTAKGRRI